MGTRFCLEPRGLAMSRPSGRRNSEPTGPAAAKLITTPLDWSDLVLAPTVLEEVDRIRIWLEHAGAIMDGWGLRRTVKPGYRGLFHGPSGTGKTLTATLIGKTVGADVYRIDLSMVASKYIGETEKNLADVFDQAENENWILFFDEADALFGERTRTAGAPDRHANQEASYLLQRVEDFPGLVIFATSLEGNIDDAITRRFQSVIFFPMPDPEQRMALWKGAVGTEYRLDEDVDLARLAQDYALSGGAITDVVRYGVVTALQDGRDSVRQADFIEGIRRELRREGRTP